MQVKFPIAGILPTASIHSYLKCKNHGSECAYKLPVAIFWCNSIILHLFSLIVREREGNNRFPSETKPFLRNMALKQFLQPVLPCACHRPGTGLRRFLGQERLPLVPDE